MSDSEEELSEYVQECHNNKSSCIEILSFISTYVECLHCKVYWCSECVEDGSVPLFCQLCGLKCVVNGYLGGEVK